MPEVLDISSDEEEGLEESLTVTDFSWIREMLLTSDEEFHDSVEVVHENRSELKSKSSTLTVKDVGGDDGDDDDDDGDDDCVVLEGDPENGVASVEEEANGSDELLVIGEKGQIACRDYPHARHLCGKFPFSSTLHAKHCSQCHCYVCESLAPCLKWGTGILSSDHCHANETEVWKIQRKNFKLGQSSPLPASTNFGTSVSPGHPQHNEFLPPCVSNLSNSVLPNQAFISAAVCTIPSLSSIPQSQASRLPTTRFLSASSPNSSVQNQVFRPINTPIMSPATNITMSNGANHGMRRESRPTLVRNRYQPHSVTRPALGVRSHTIQRERGNGSSSLRPQVLRPHVVSRGVGSAGNTLMANNSPHGSPVLGSAVDRTQQHLYYRTATGFQNYGNCNGPYDVYLPTNISFYSQSSSQSASLSCVNQHTMASETQTYSQPLPQSNNSQGFLQNCIQVSGAPSSYVPQEAASQDTCQTQPQQSHEESPRETAGKFSAFDSSWINNSGQSIPQSSRSVVQPPNSKESDAQFTGSNEPLVECSQLDSSMVDFDDDWFLEKTPFPVLTDGILPSDMNIPSSDFYAVDMSMGLW